jgi:biopolymer transport protein ExbB
MIKTLFMNGNRKINTEPVLAFFIIPLSVVVAYLVYQHILGHPSNFVNGAPSEEPVDGNYLGFIYKGGPVVIVLISFQVILLSYIVERLITLSKARGKANNNIFVEKVKTHLDEEQVDEAIQECDTQKGSVANVIKNGLSTYKKMKKDDNNHKENKLAVLQRKLKDTIHLELPLLNKNLPILGTLASIATLTGLLGTILGMIKAFSALAQIGAPDAVGLANGISQALVTTALGISTAVVAIIFNNYFSNRVDKITEDMREGYYAIMQTFRINE